MMQHSKIKRFVLLFLLLMSVELCGVFGAVSDDGAHINIQPSHVQGIPKGDAIVASIDGHALSVVFLENLGQVSIRITTSNGIEVDASRYYTPSGVNFYISDIGSYIITFSLPNGDEYYGEFEVTD